MNLYLSNNAIVTVPYKLVGTIGKDIPVELGKIYGGTWSLIDYSEDYLKYQSDTGKEIELMCDY